MMIGFLVRGRVRLGLGLWFGLRSTMGFTAGAIVAGANVGHSDF